MLIIPFRKRPKYFYVVKIFLSLSQTLDITLFIFRLFQRLRDEWFTDNLSDITCGISRNILPIEN